VLAPGREVGAGCLPVLGYRQPTCQSILIGSAMENPIALPILTAYSGALYAAYKILLCVLDNFSMGARAIATLSQTVDLSP